MTTNLHKTAPMGQIHSPVNFTFTTAALRQAQAGLSTIHLGCEAMQTDTSPPTFWKIVSVSGGTATWRQITTAADVVGSTGTPLTLITSVPVTAWLRADLGVTIGTGVSAWVDQTANAFSFAQATGANQPTRNAADSTLGNQATITGDGVNDQVNSSAIVVPAAFWMCFVMKQIGWTSGARCVESVSSTSKANILQGSATPGLQLREDVISTAQNSNAAIGAWKRITTQESNATTDGILVGATFVGGTALGRTATSNQFTLFAAWSGSSNANVAIAEMIMTTGIPTSGEKTAIDSYLQTRYGLASLFT